MSDWQPIETAPRDGTIFDVWLGDCEEADRHFYCSPATRRSPDWHWRDGKFRPAVKSTFALTTFVEPTHWMPLPGSPK